MSLTQDALRTKVADEVFIATALLHRENPDREDFTISEIVARAEREDLFGKLRPGVRVHATLHCVANLAPNPGRYRMLYATDRHTRRLLRSTDDVHPKRTGKTWPEPEDLPAQYQELIAWAKQRYGKDSPPSMRWIDGIFHLRGMGRQLWEGEDPDEYVRKLRENWG
ncbi:MAG: hypothetical protein KIT09_29710 [Bryobacteraceae bacterium]|nr:hypothetical protein [Bryobacteraceae bacterium]